MWEGIHTCKSLDATFQQHELNILILSALQAKVFHQVASNEAGVQTAHYAGVQSESAGIQPKMYWSW